MSLVQFLVVTNSLLFGGYMFPTVCVLGFQSVVQLWLTVSVHVSVCLCKCPWWTDTLSIEFQWLVELALRSDINNNNHEVISCGKLMNTLLSARLLPSGHSPTQSPLCSSLLTQSFGCRAQRISVKYQEFLKRKSFISKGGSVWCPEK